MIRRLTSLSSFGRNVLTLMTGMVISQAIPIAASPILTRLYSPEDFGILALFMSLATIVSVVASLRYELAIVQPVADADAACILVLSCLITLSMSFLSLVGVLLFKEEITRLFGNPDIAGWLYLLPASIFFKGIFQSFSFWNIRKERYKKISRSRVLQSSSTVAGQIGTASLNYSGGLVWGLLFGQALSSASLAVASFKRDREALKAVSIREISRNAMVYKKFPTYSSAGALSDNLAIQMPVIVLSKFYDLGITGLFSLTFRVLNLPAALISQALSQVLLKNLTILHQETPESIRALILRIFFKLFALMIPFVLLMVFFGEELFAFVFGEPWREAGQMASILVIAVAFRFSISPLSAVLVLEHNVRLGTFWQFVYLCTISATLLLASNYESHVFFIAFTVHEVILYGFYLFLILKGSGGYR